MRVPGAVRYGSFKVDAYGQRSVPGFADQGFLFYEDDNHNITSKGGILGSSMGWHAGNSVPGGDYVDGSHVLHWWAGTSDHNYYDIKSFRMRLTYYVLS